MERSSTRCLSALFTLSPLDLMRPGTTRWRRSFPFSSRYGTWTFSGRVALALGMQRLGIAPGSTILVPAYFQGTEIDTLLFSGYRLEFYRLDRGFNVDLNDVERSIEGAAALYIIHYFGFPQRLRELSRFCRERGILLIEDCALGLFSRDGDEWLGSAGDLALFSLFKSLPLPHGGFLVTRAPGDDDRLLAPPLRSTLIQMADLMVEGMRKFPSRTGADRIRTLTSFGRRALGWRREETITSGSTLWDPRLLQYRSSTIVQRLMRQIDPAIVVKRRRENYLHLASLLIGRAEVPFEELPDGVCPLFFPLLVDDKGQLQRELVTRGIGSVNLWSDSHPACPAALAKEVRPWRQRLLELPIHQQLSLDDVDRIGRTVLTLIRQRRIRRSMSVAAAGEPVRSRPGTSRVVRTSIPSSPVQEEPEGAEAPSN